MNKTCFRCLLVAAACLGLAGCAPLMPEQTARTPVTPASWNRIDPAAQPAVLADPVGDIAQWWQRLGDPLLTALIEEGRLASPDLRSARARVREARARRTVAAADQAPGLTASAQASRSRSSEETGSGAPRNFFSASLDAAWEVDLFGRIHRGVDAADADLDVARANFDGAQVSLAAEIAQNYVEVRAAQLRLAIARANLDAQSETLQLTEWRAEAGLASSQEVEQARSNREQTRALLPVLEISLAEAEHALDGLLGQPPGTLHARLAGSAALPAVPARLAVGIPADALRQRPDVRAAERALAAEIARTGAAEAARYPSFRLSGSLGVEALRVGALGNGGATAASLLGSLAAPLFDAGRLRAQAEAQDAVRERAQVSYEQTVLAALREAENALVGLARTREREQALADAAGAARRAAELARQRYGAGLIDFQSVLDTERTRLSVEDSLARTRADGVLALIRLYKALGGGWSPPDAADPARKEPT